jgi:hypothetical protein
MANLVQIYHVGWIPGGVPGHPEIVRFVFTEHLPSALTTIVSTGMLIGRFTTRLWAETSWRNARLQPTPRAFLCRKRSGMTAAK